MNKTSSKRTWLEINRTALYHNIDQLKGLIGAMQLGIVVKANAYGHGIELVAPLFAQHPAVDWLFTATIQEALTVRATGVTKPVLVMSYYDAPFEEAIVKNIDLVVYDYQTACTISSIAKKVGVTASLHLKINTGMNRFGVSPTDAVALAQKIQALSHIQLHGIFTHFSHLNIEDLTHSYNQLAEFDTVIEQCALQGITFTHTHILSSGALVLPTKNSYSLVRVGTNVYGFWKNDLQKQRFLEKKPDFSLQQVLTWKTHIVHIQEIPAHAPVGYNRAYYTNKTVIAALLPLGYYDGYPRALSNKSFVIINGHKAPVIGIVSMSIIMADITGIPAQPGDEVIVSSNYPGITIDDLATSADTISNEFATRINPLLPRKVL